MKIVIELNSALAEAIHHTQVIVPPFRTIDQGFPSIQTWTEPKKFPIGTDGAPGSKQMSAPIPLGPEQIKALEAALDTVQISPSRSADNIDGVMDGWTTVMSIESFRTKVQMRWFCDPPKQWKGIDTLVDAINRILIDLQRAAESK